MLSLLVLPASAQAKPPRKFYGVIPQSALGSADYANMAKGRVGTLRTTFYWPSIQPRKGKCTPTGGACTWAQLDALVRAAANANVEVIPMFYGTPKFVSKKKSNKPPLKKKHLRMWRAFVGAAAKRYGRKGAFWRQSEWSYSSNVKPIKVWQVWNEPNSRQFWSGKPHGRKYAKLLRASTKSLRKGDRRARVVLGGMYGNAKVPLPKYLGQLYSVKRIKRFFDEVAIHPYAAKMKPLKRQIRQARKAARRNGDRKVGIRLTELGWSSKSGNHRLMKGRKGQAKMLRKSFRLLTSKRKAWKIKGISWYAWEDTNDRDTCRFCRHAGLFKVNGKAKPSWRAFKKFTR